MGIKVEFINYDADNQVFNYQIGKNIKGDEDKGLSE